MMNKSRDGWYAPLAARFQGMEEPMPLARFAAIEAILHLLALNAPATDPAKAYLLFTQYQLIGTTACTAMEHTLQQARHTLGYYRSQNTGRMICGHIRIRNMMQFALFRLRNRGKVVRFPKQRGNIPIRISSAKGSGNDFGRKDLKKPSRLLMPEPEHIAIRI